MRLLVGLLIAVLLLGTSWSLSEYFGSKYFSSKMNDGQTGTGSTGYYHGSSYTEASLLIDFGKGNGTRLWFNDTRVAAGDSFYNITSEDVRGDLVSAWYGYPLEAHFVYKIMGYGCYTSDSNCGGYWSLWVWNNGQQCWSFSPLGADLLKVPEIGTVAWYFTGYGPISFIGSCT